jgi:hypothetical protein
MNALLPQRDKRSNGPDAIALGVLVALQGLHTIEHLARWFQFHVLRWPLLVSRGLIAAADVEWVHFVWNVGFLLLCAYLVARGMRGPWAWLLLAWAAAHTFEHSYILWRYLRTAQELAALGVGDVPPHELPGILGRDGWLASADATQGAFLSRLPGLTTAARLDVHFWWNVGQLALLLPAADAHMRRILKTVTNPPRSAAGRRV